jgi:hypothetical protein
MEKCGIKWTVLVLLLFGIVCSNKLVSQCTLDICTVDDCGPVNIGFASANNGIVICESELASLENISATDFTYYVIDWSDGTLDTLFTIDTVYHQYYIPDSILCEGSQLVDICFIGVLECGNGNISCAWGSFTFGLELRPQADFISIGPYCTDKEIVFGNTSCNEDSYLWSFGDGQTSTLEDPVHVYEVPGTYVVSLTVTNECGTDQTTSTIAVYEPAEPLITIENDVLIASQTNGSIQWVNCDNFSPIAGKTDTVFFPESSGSYAYIVEEGGCLDTAACVEIIISGTVEEQGKHALYCFPNPTTDRLHISHESASILTYELASLTGCVVMSGGQNEIVNSINLAAFPKGMYVLRVWLSNQSTHTLKIIKA